MARNWIKIETATPDKPEVCVIATFLKIDPDAALGKLIRLWAWADVNKINGNAVGVTRGFIDKVVGQKGFADALEHAEWLSGNDGELVFTKFSKHNGKAARGRAQTAERVSRHRELKRGGNNAAVTKALPNAAQAEEVAEHDGAESNHTLDVNTIDNQLIESTLEEVVTSDLAAVETEPVPVEEVSATIEESNDEQVVPDEFNAEANDSIVSKELHNEERDPASDASEKGRKRVTGAGSSRKAVVAEPPDQPFLF